MTRTNKDLAEYLAAQKIKINPAEKVISMTVAAKIDSFDRVHPLNERQMAYLMAGVAQRTVYKLRKEVDEKLSKLPLKYFDGRTHGEILSRAVNDMDNISSTLQQSVTQLITSVVTLVGVLVMMLSISWLLTLIVLATLPLRSITGIVAK